MMLDFDFEQIDLERTICDVKHDFFVTFKLISCEKEQKKNTHTHETNNKYQILVVSVFAAHGQKWKTTQYLNNRK